MFKPIKEIVKEINVRNATTSDRVNILLEHKIITKEEHRGMLDDLESRS
jgi:DNA-binding Lrp family transcriptional regulator